MLKDKLQPFLRRYDELSTLLAEPEITNDIASMTKLSKEQKGLENVVNAAKSYLAILEQIAENKALLGDAELGELAKEELDELEKRLPEVENELKILLLPRDKMTTKISF